MTKFFGTDGIRGIAGKGAITVDFCLNLVDSVCEFLINNNLVSGKKIIIAKDTRQSGDFLEHAISAAFAKNGFSVDLTGVFPSPALSLVCKFKNYDLGVVISASHNPFEYNGIKFFNSQGSKLSVKDEEEIEQYIEKGSIFSNNDSIFGEVKDISKDAETFYVNYILKEFSKLNWHDFSHKVILDMANGAAYKVAESIFDSLFGENNVIKVGNSPNGLNINKGCGSTNLALLRDNVKKYKNAIGIALDGDADRVIMLDKEGNEINGDVLIGIIAESLYRKKRLKKDTVIVTQMTNLGLIESLKERGIKTETVDVGDRNISNKMDTDDLNFGGEQSGHIIVKDFAPSGDGIIGALFVLQEILLQNKPIDGFKKSYKEYAQKLENITVSNEVKNKIDLKDLQDYGQEILRDKGRVVLRKSGTEPLIRILVEAQDDVTISTAIDFITQKLNSVIKLLTKRG